MAAYRVGMEIVENRTSMAVVDNQGTLLCRRVFSGSAARNAERYADTLCDHLEDMLLKRGLQPADLQHIGLSVDGVVDAARGVVEYAPAMFGPHEVNVAALVEGRTGVLPTVVREGWAAAWAERLFGSARNLDHLLCVTLGQAVGCGIILGGTVFTGALRTAGELCDGAAHSGAACPFAGAALLAQARVRFPDKLPSEKAGVRDVFALASAGDAAAMALVAEALEGLAMTLASAVNLLGVPTVVLAGRYAQPWADYLTPLRERMLALGHPAWAKRFGVEVLNNGLGGDSAMIGAAFLTQAELKSGW